jgi:initiation factor 1A
MVKNFGGNKAKGFARKSFAKTDKDLRISQEPDEIYAQVTKIYGGKNCQVTTLDGTEMLCHIRGKFSGRGKRDNFIGNGTWMLVGKREWEKESAKGKLLNCDVIEVYNDADKIKLKNNVTSVNWHIFITNDSKTIGSDDNEGVLNDVIEFADEKTQEYQELINAQVTAAHSGKANIIISTDDGEEIDVDDI